MELYFSFWSNCTFTVLVQSHRSVVLFSEKKTLKLAINHMPSTKLPGKHSRAYFSQRIKSISDNQVARNAFKWTAVCLGKCLLGGMSQFVSAAHIFPPKKTVIAVALLNLYEFVFTLIFYLFVLCSCTPAPPWVLENPPPRPLASSPSGLSSSQYPSRLGISMTTRISATVESGCHSGSMFCSILWILPGTYEWMVSICHTRGAHWL